MSDSRRKRTMRKALTDTSSELEYIRNRIDARMLFTLAFIYKIDLHLVFLLRTR